jgi:hypothetical protein
MNSTNAGNAINKSWLFLIPALALTLTWVLSIRPVRLKIANYYFQNCKYEQASSWYEKVVRKEKLDIRQGGSNHLKYEDDLSKLKSALLPVMEERLLKNSQILGFGEGKDLKSLLVDPQFFLKDINHLVGDEPKKQLQRVKEDLDNFINISSYYKNLLEEKTNSSKLNYFVSIGYFLAGIADEAEGNFLSADSNYEKALDSQQTFSSQINERGKKILPKVADEYFSRSPLIRKVGNANVILQSESPLVVIGTVPGVGNYLLYEICPVNLIIQKYTSTGLRIKGEVQGGNSESCIIPRVIFWGPKGYVGKTALKGYVGETGLKYSIKGKFDIKFKFSVPSETANISPMITFDGSCMSEGKKIVVEEVKWN